MGEKIAFIGLGNMGLPMARNLIESGFAVAVYNRTPEKAQTLLESGAKKLNHSYEAFAFAPLVITMVANDQALEEIVLGKEGILAHSKKGDIHLSMSTIAPQTTRRLAQLHEEKGVAYLAAPVFGRPDAAAARKLWICLAGQQSAKERVKPVLENLGQTVFDVGQDPSQANVVKLAGNFLILSAVEAMAEAFTFVEKNGVDRDKVAQFFSQTMLAAPVYQNYGKLVAKQHYEPAGFKLGLGLKDIRLLLEAAEQSQTPMPLGSLLHDRLIASLAKGRKEMDWAAIALIAAEEAGQPIKS